MGLDKGTGYLGAGMVYKDLERFYLTDAGLEKVAKAFLEANDAAAPGMFRLAGTLLADKDVAASAGATSLASMNVLATFSSPASVR